MPDYANGKIYKLVSNLTNNIYIGSTCRPLHQRHFEHKQQYKQFQDNKGHYITSFELIKLGATDIVLIENFPCNDKNELHARERFHIEQNKFICVNKHIPIRTKNEWLEYHLEYRIENTVKLRQQQAEYYVNNKETIQQYYAEYYVNNKEAIQQTKKNLVTCDCGRQLRHADMAAHKRTQIHNYNMQAINEFQRLSSINL